MAVAQETQFLHLARPVVPSVATLNSSVAPLSVTIQPQAIVSILDHAVRRETSSTQSTRVIGALVGIRSEDGLEAEVRSCFAIPHTETDDQVEVDVEYQKNMLALTLKAASSPRECLLGWYTTSHTLDSFSALIQNFFAAPDTGTFPHPAVHLTISTEPGQPITTRSYVSAPVAASADRASESCFFVEVPHRLLVGDADRAALEAVSSSAATAARTAPVVSDVEALARSIEQTLDLLNRTSDYVGAVLDEDTEPNQALGQYLMNAMSLAPKVDNASVERDFNNHIQDVLMVSYLTNTIRTQIDLSQRLATATINLGGIGGGDKDDKKDGAGEDGKQRDGQRGGKRGGRGGGRGGSNSNHPREQREPRELREPREPVE